jgi:hypothetical protein
MFRLKITPTQHRQMGCGAFAAGRQVPLLGKLVVFRNVGYCLVVFRSVGYCFVVFRSVGYCLVVFRSVVG